MGEILGENLKVEFGGVEKVKKEIEEWLDVYGVDFGELFGDENWIVFKGIVDGEMVELENDEKIMEILENKKVEKGVVMMNIVERDLIEVYVIN